MDSPENHFSESFALQFISLILFILIFTIWSFLPKLVKHGPKKDVTVDRVMDPRGSDDTPIFREVLSKKYFSDESFTLNETAWKSLREMVFQHDLSLHLKVKNVADARIIFERLLESEFPEESILVEADSTMESEEVLLAQGDSIWR